MTEHIPPASAPVTAKTGWETSYATHERQLAEVRPVNKAALLAALAAAGVTHVIVSFDGGGDEGQIENVEAKAADILVSIPVGDVGIVVPAWDQTEPELRMMPIADAVEHIAWDCLGTSCSGWENGDGAYGEITFDIAAGSIVLDFNGRYTASDYSQYVF